MRYRPSGNFAPREGLCDAPAVQSMSRAVTGFLKLRSAGLELDEALGPEASGIAPVPYERSVVLARPRTVWGGVIRGVKVSASSDFGAQPDTGFVSSEVHLGGIDLEVTRHLRLRASGVSARCLVSRRAGQISSGIDVVLDHAALELDGVGTIELPRQCEVGTVVRPDLLEPLGLRLIVNEQSRVPATSLRQTVCATALRLVFEGAALGGEILHGELEIAAAKAALDLRTAERAERIEPSVRA